MALIFSLMNSSDLKTLLNHNIVSRLLGKITFFFSTKQFNKLRGVVRKQLCLITRQIFLFFYKKIIYMNI